MAVAVTLAALLCAVVIGAQAAPHPDFFPSRLRGGSVYNDAVRKHDNLRLNGVSNALRNTTVNYFDQLIDHTDAAKGTFKQRYYYDLSHYNPTGGEFKNPTALMYINGEGPASGSPEGYIADVAYNMSSAIFTLEHRYYGESLPGPLTDKSLFMSTLNIENVLEDLFDFVNFAESNVLKKQNVVWYIAGGSYSGALSAWMKQKYPTKFAAAWSSSGVVNPRFDYYNFDGHIVSVIPQNCAANVRKMYDAVSDAYDNENTRDALYTTLGTPKYFSKADIAWMLADGIAMAVQYGSKDAMCNTVVPLSSDPIAQLASYIKSAWGDHFTASCYYSTTCLSDPQYSNLWGPDGYSWVYQCCSQVAFWQSSYPDSLRMKEITTDYFIGQCRSAYSPDILPDTYSFNRKYGGATPNATNVIATQGSDDPWSPAGVEASLGPRYPEVTAQCAGCGHCGDMQTPSSKDPASLSAQRTAILSYLRQWVQEAADATA